MIFLNILCLAISITSALGGYLDRPKYLPCKLDDTSCIKDMSQWLLSTVVQGVSEYGIESSDPMYHDVIENNFGSIKYKVTKTNVEGMKTCGVQKASINSTGTAVHLELICRRSHIDGVYDVKGDLLGVPVIGIGSFNADTTNYLCLFDSEITYYEKDSQMYFKYSQYTFKCELMGELDLNLRTLSTKPADKERFEKTYSALMPLAKANAKLFASLVDRPMHSENFRRIINSFNKMLGRIPVSNLIQAPKK